MTKTKTNSTIARISLEHSNILNSSYLDDEVKLALVNGTGRMYQVVGPMLNVYQLTLINGQK